MRLYHGSGQFDQIMKEGLVLDSGNKTDFDDTGALTSLGGIYMTDRVDVAAFYAAKATSSECSLGMDPCVFVLDVVDEDTLIADRTKSGQSSGTILSSADWALMTATMPSCTPPLMTLSPKMVMFSDG